MHRYTKTAAYYDALYAAAGKDYASEARRVHELIQQHKRSPGSALLDVACGTGGHMAVLRQHYAIEGLDLDPDMLAIARHKYPGIVFHQGDMTAFDLGRRFDAIICLFGAIAYTLAPEVLRQAIRTMTRHLLPGGVMVVEPFIKPEDWREHHVAAVFVDQPDLKIARMNTGWREGHVAVFDFYFLVGRPEGIEHFTERHGLAMFTREEYLDAFRAAGLGVSYDPQGLMGRGLYVGTRPAGSIV
jgi:ubiquinone/menaquinone biosynthesis C-methylase UbiE